MTNKPKVLFLDTLHPTLHKELETLNYNCVELSSLGNVLIHDIIQDYYGIVLRSKITLNKAILSKATNLKFIARAGAGMENIDVEYAESRGIHCIKAPEGNMDAVADHAMGMLLALFNNLNKADLEVRRGIWERESNRGVELTGKTIGILGYGCTGSAFAKRLKGFDTKVLAYDKYKTGFSNDYVTESTMEQIYKESDIVSIHLPHTDETDYMIGQTFFDQFKKPIFLINTSRGKIIRTKDLVNNLKSKRIIGACLDVLEYESNSFERLKGLGMWTNKRGILINRLGAWLMKNGLWIYLHPVQYLVKCKNVILSPHIAGWSFESYEKISLVLAKRIKELNTR